MFVDARVLWKCFALLVHKVRQCLSVTAAAYNQAMLSWGTVPLPCCLRAAFSIAIAWPSLSLQILCSVLLYADIPAIRLNLF
jgi:hypothetical protein